MTAEYAIGIIGCGLIGSKRAKSFPESCRLVSVFDINDSAAMALVSEVNSGRVANSIEEVIRDPEIDIVVVATAHSSLASVALAAVRNGKHVLIEKPGARSVNELNAVKKEAEAAGVLVRVGYNHRFHPSMSLAHDLINSHQYGELLWVRGRYGHGGRIGYDKEWRAIRETSGGGELLDQGSHLIDLTRFFFGDLTLSHSHISTAFWNMEVEDNAFLHLQTASGATAWLHASWTEWKNTFSLEITLRTAKIDISGLGGSYGKESLTLYEMQPEMGPPPNKTWNWDGTDNSWSLEMKDFLNAVQGTKTIGATINDALATLTIIGEAYAK